MLSRCLLLVATAAMLTVGGQVLQMELWCVAKNNADDSSLQTAIDWACGQGGADCGPIQPGGSCNDPADVQKMASFVFNNYYLKNNMADDACNFDNNAAITSINPSQGRCKYPSSKRVDNGREADDTSRAQAELSGGRQLSTSWIVALIGFGSLLTMTRIIHHL